MRFFKMFVSLSVFIIISSCQSNPKIAITDPYFIDSDILRINFYVGAKIYFIKLINKTESNITVDLEKSSIVTTSGEAESLGKTIKYISIPAKSNYILAPMINILGTHDIDDFIYGDFFSRLSRVFTSEMNIIQMSQNKVIKILINLNYLNQERQMNFDVKIK